MASQQIREYLNRAPFHVSPLSGGPADLGKGIVELVRLWILFQRTESMVQENIYRTEECVPFLKAEKLAMRWPIALVSCSTTI